MFDLKDGGFKSRKFIFSFFTSVCILVAGLIAGRWPAFSPGLPYVINGLIYVLAIFVGGNAAIKWITGNHQLSALKIGTDQPEEVKSEEKKAD